MQVEMGVVGMAVVLLLSGCVETGVPDRADVEANAGQDGEAGVAMRLAGPGGAALLVPVRVNGQGPYDFVLDTGATLTCVDSALADSLALPEARGQLGVGAGVQGTEGSMRLVVLDSIAVGSARAEGLTGCAIDLAQLQSLGLEVRGLLGLNFLSSFRVTLDFAADRLTLDDP